MNLRDSVRAALPVCFSIPCACCGRPVLGPDTEHLFGDRVCRWCARWFGAELAAVGAGLAARMAEPVGYFERWSGGP